MIDEQEQQLEQFNKLRSEVFDDIRIEYFIRLQTNG